MDIAVVFGLIVLALILFITELLPVDVIALILLVLTVVLEPWTGISPEDGVSGFSNPATLTVLAMFILSDGLRRTGFVSRVGEKLTQFTRNRPTFRFGSLIGLSGLTAGFLNNTPVVAMMVPMVSEIARKTRTSPSRYLMPISFAAMLGGMLTLIGTSTNILASNVSERLLGHPFSMFEFTRLGALVLIVGLLYLHLIGRRLIPERVEPGESIQEQYESGYQGQFIVRRESILMGRSVLKSLQTSGGEINIIRLIRDGNEFDEFGRMKFDEGDKVLFVTDKATLLRLHKAEEFELEPVTDGDEMVIEEIEAEFLYTEVVILSESPVVGSSLESLNFSERYDAIVLAIRRGGKLIDHPLQQVPLRGGDTLLTRLPRASIQRLNANRSFVTTEEIEEPLTRTSRIPVALSIISLVIVLTAAGVLPILISSLLGVVLMVLSGCVRPNEIYQAVDWNVIFLLAGIIPLGMALERSGGAELLANLLIEYSSSWPPVLILASFYLFTSLITQVISNNASVILMIPVSVSAANFVDANPFSFVLAVTFAASTAMLTPVGYQTNLMVFGPGGYKFSDFARVGAPLQLLLALVTSVGIWYFWGI